MPTYRDFNIAAIDFDLFKERLLLLALSIVSEQDTTPRQGYIVSKINGNNIVMPRQATTYTCSATSCPSTCSVAGQSGGGIKLEFGVIVQAMVTVDVASMFSIDEVRCLVSMSIFRLWVTYGMRML